jgi:hypothetical protein
MLDAKLNYKYNFADQCGWVTAEFLYILLANFSVLSRDRSRKKCIIPKIISFSCITYFVSLFDVKISHVLVKKSSSPLFKK